MKGITLSEENLGVLKDLLMSEKAHSVILNFIECLENTAEIITIVNETKLETQRKISRAKTKVKRKNKQKIKLSNKKYEPSVSYGYKLGEPNSHYTLTDSAKHNRAKLIQTATKAEKKFIGILKSNDIKYEFQKICYYESSYYIVDFFIPESRLVVEIDGRYHDSSEQQRDDQLRTRRLIKLCNISNVIRFTNDELDNKDAVLFKLNEYLPKE